MKKKVLIVIISIIILITILWITGIIPKQIGKIYGTKYIENNFPEMQLEYDNIEWNKYYGDYIITFKDRENQNYGCVIGTKYLPISIGQGINSIIETYQEKYSQNTNKEEFDVGNKIDTIIGDGDQNEGNDDRALHPLQSLKLRCWR